LTKHDPIRCVHSNDKFYTLEYTDGTVVKPEGLVSTQEEWPHKVNLDEILWKNVSDTPDIEGRYYERRIFNLAVMAWEWKSKVNIREARSGETPFIRNDWSDKENDDLFARRPGVLYYAYLPGQGSLSGLMVGNDDYLWGGHPGVQPLPTGGGAKIYDLQHTTIHELGHILGLRHEDTDRTSVMWFSYNEQRVPQENDISRIQAKYNSKFRFPWVSFWIKRRLQRGIRQQDLS